MKISKVREALAKLEEREGDIEVTCMHSLQPEGEGPFPNHFETTVENFIVNDPDDKVDFKRVRLWL